MTKKKNPQLELIECHGKLISSFFQESYFTMKNYLAHQPRPAITHFVAHVPTTSSKNINTEACFEKFINSLNERLPVLGVCTTNSKDNLEKNILGNFWFRVQKSKLNIEYHVFLLTNRDVQFYMGNGQQHHSALYQNVVRYWCEAHGVDPIDFDWIVSERSFKAINFSSGSWPASLLTRMEYIASLSLTACQHYPTPWEDGIAMYGSSPSLQRPPWER